jgi:hypothetical protein
VKRPFPNLYSPKCKSSDPSVEDGTTLTIRNRMSHVFEGVAIAPANSAKGWIGGTTARQLSDRGHAE